MQTIMTMKVREKNLTSMLKHNKSLHTNKKPAPRFLIGTFNHYI